jgi:hypothetical protein
MTILGNEETGMRKKWFIFAPLAIIGFALFIAVGGQLVHLLWNWLLPPIFGWRQITFWQALGLLALCRILFGGFGVRGAGRSNMRRRMEERCKNMTPEERERFRQGMRARWGFGPSTGESTERH